MALYGLIVPGMPRQKFTPSSAVLITEIVVPFRLEQLGYDNIAALTGWLVAAYAGGLLVSSPIIGYLGEKIKNRRIALVSALLFMAGAIVMFMLGHKFWILLVARILQGFSGTGEDNLPHRHGGSLKCVQLSGLLGLH